jgi:hypothetical protein
MWRVGPTAGWSRIARTERRVGSIERKLNRLRYPLLWRALEDADVHTPIPGRLAEQEMTVLQPTDDAHHGAGAA